MVKYQVLTTAQALDQLQHILDFIIESDSLGKAQIAFEGITEAIEALEVFPNAHSVYQTIKQTEHTYRFKPKWSFNIIYKVEENPPRVIIITIANAKQSKERVEKLLQ
jgi:plasmid stabilization system protein ParE